MCNFAPEMEKRLILYLILLCAGACVRAQEAVGGGFSVEMVPDSVLGTAAEPPGTLTDGMPGSTGTLTDGMPGSIRDELRLVRVLHVDFEGKTREGLLICNRTIAEDVLDIFRQLYEARYPIERIRPISEYGNDDERSMRANNTSCFCYRRVAGSQKLSKHAQGLAIDLNPLYNPHVKVRDGRRMVAPATAERYANRNRSFPHKITRQSLPCRLFRKKGFSWGGDWRSSKDYQHFER